MEWLIINLTHIIKQRSVKHGLGFENNRYGRSYAGTFCEVFFVSKAHRKNENLGAKSCECMISVHPEACCWSQSEQ